VGGAGGGCVELRPGLRLGEQRQNNPKRDLLCSQGFKILAALGDVYYELTSVRHE
jgi:hypothetical protein